MLADHADKTLTTTATTAVNHIDEHHKTAVAHVDSDKHPSAAASVETAAIKSSEQVAKKAVEDHHNLTAQVAKTTDDKDVAKTAEDSSKAVTAHSADSHAAAHGGLNWGLILALVALLLALLAYFMFM